MINSSLVHLNILVYSETFLPDLGGLEKNTLTLCNSLQQLGYRTKLLTSTLDKTLIKYSFPVYRTKNSLIKWNEIRKANIVIINGGLAMKIAFPSFLLNKKYILIFQMATLDARSDIGFRGSLIRYIRNYFIKKASVNVTVNNYSNQFLPSKISNTVLLNPFDSTSLALNIEFDPTKKTKKYDFFFAGRIIEGKGVFLLMEALSILSLSNKVVGAIAGDGPELDKLKEMCQEKQIEVIFLGRLNTEKLLDTCSISKLLVVPSTTHIEGSPLIIAESISMGTPVLVSDQPAMIEISGKAGLHFKSGNVNDLVLKLKEILFVEPLLTQLENACVTEATKFTLAQYQQRLSLLLNRL